jgi:hypothetical protein
MFIVVMYLLAFLASAAVFTAIPGSPLNKAVRGGTKVKALPGQKVRSWPANQIVAKNNSLPVEHRISGLESVVDAMDVKYIVRDVNEHFQDSTYSGVRASWSHHCYGRCSYKQYTEMYDGLTEIADAIETQKHTLKVAAVADELRRVDDVIAQIKAEKGFVVDTTKALTTGY